MVGCQTLTKGQTLYCEGCGLELRVTKTCSECESDETCCAGDCTFECCGEPLKVK